MEARTLLGHLGHRELRGPAVKEKICILNHSAKALTEKMELIVGMIVRIRVGIHVRKNDYLRLIILLYE